MPERGKNESKRAFIQRCMRHQETRNEFPDPDQRYAVCVGMAGLDEPTFAELVSDALEDKQLAKMSWNEDIDDFEDKSCCEGCNDCNFGSVEDLTENNLYFPEQSEYATIEEVEFDESDIEEYELSESCLVKAAEYQGRKVTLNKPFRTPDGPKKFAVYTKNGSGKVVIVRFGDPNMKIKKNIPERRKSFRARHNCDNPGPKWKARYWACKSW